MAILTGSLSACFVFCFSFLVCESSFLVSLHVSFFVVVVVENWTILIKYGSHSVSLLLTPGFFFSLLDDFSEVYLPPAVLSIPWCFSGVRSGAHSGISRAIFPSFFDHI